MVKQMLIGLVLVIFMTGCTANNNQATINTNQERIIHVKNTSTQTVDRQTGQNISKRLVTIASDLPNVNDATAVVLGKYAIVGIDVKENLDRTDVGSIKYSVAESLKNDPYGAKSIVIADPDINARLKAISEDIEEGKPLQGIMNELAAIAGRLIPEIPADMVNPSQKKATEKPKKKLENSEDQQLENKQQEQSNHHIE